MIPPKSFVVIIPVLLLAISAAAQKNKTTQLTLKLESKTVKLKLVEHQGLKLSENCLKKKNCDALRSGLAKFHHKPPPHPAMNHPASLYCKGMGGKSFIAADAKNNEVDVCQFPDETYLDSWSAYLKHYPTSIVK